MKKLIMILLIVLMLPLTGFAYSVPVDGSYFTAGVFNGHLDEDDPGLVTSGSWSQGFTIEWNVYQPIVSGKENYYKYEYTLSWENGAVSHFILGVSDNFSLRNLFWPDAPGSIVGPQWFGPSGSNPGLPAIGIYGLKFDFGGGSTSFTYSFWSDRAPMWGDFYAKDGQAAAGGDWNYAYNDGIGEEPVSDFSRWIPVPDTLTVQTPEPVSFLLLGLGLLGIAGITRRK